MDGGDSENAEFSTFLAAHLAQLQSAGVPNIYWASLYLKLKRGVFDGDNSFVFERYPSDEDGKTFLWKIVISSEEGFQTSDPVNIFVISHAWTFRTGMARQQLETIPGFLDRMVHLMDLEQEGKTTEELLEDVLKESWKYCMFYKVADAELGSTESFPIWFVMDEFGSRIQHSDEPSFACVPFYYLDHQVSYSLLWPLKDLQDGDEVTRNYAYGTPMNDPLREFKMLPWVRKDFSHVAFEQTEPEDSLFGEYHGLDNLEEGDCRATNLANADIIKVFTDETLVKQFLTDSKFEIVDTMQEANVVWMQKAVTNFREIFETNPSMLVNQFPCEKVLNCKDLMYLVAQRVAPPTGLKWLCTTYNLNTELDKFVAYFQHRQELGFDNTWICKCWNLARSFNMQVTDNLNCLVRLADTGPKIACKYINDCVLYDRADVGLVKFDLRYNLLLTSLKPLKLYAQKVFWLRVANLPYSLDQLDVYEKHFTVMNYGDTKLEQVHSSDFVEAISRQYPDICWDEIQSKIYKAFTELFTAASLREPPMGMKHLDNARGFFGLDVMLGWETNEKGERYVQPFILEVNQAGDNKRCLTYCPNFYNQTFRLLFCGEEAPDIFDRVV